MGNVYLYFKQSKVSGHSLYHFFFFISNLCYKVLQTNSNLKSACFIRASLSNSSNPVSKQICLSLPEEAVNIFLQLNSLGYISRKLCPIIFFPITTIQGQIFTACSSKQRATSSHTVVESSPIDSKGEYYLCKNITRPCLL